MNAAPELSRPHRLDRIGGGESVVTVDADATERMRLAGRFGLHSVAALHGEFRLSRTGETVRARGRVTASVVQRCVATDAPVRASIDEAIDLCFTPQPSAADEEVELSDEECDTIFYTGGAVDLGEAAAQTMALALDPYPRAADSGSVLHEAGVIGEEEAKPFSALAQLRDKMKGNG